MAAKGHAHGNEPKSEQGLQMTLNVLSLILLAALVVDFVWVFRTALHAAGH
jgi:hypothetical protein